ncbi:hypothetical protein AB851_18600 [Ralstonia pseudosolanacearum]|nr:hypothetical protein AB851_18600 [Ralstonia pseudosolanacearum]
MLLRAFLQCAVQHQQLCAANRGVQDLHACRDAFDGHMLGVIREEPAGFASFPSHPSRWVAGIDAHRFLLTARHLPELDKQERAFIAGRLVG